MNKALTIGALGAVFFGAATSFADPAATAGKPQVSAQLDYGIFTGDDGGSDINPYGLGIGLKGGYTLDMNLYVGAGFDYYFGESNEVSLGPLGSGEFSMNVWTLQAEVGYDVGLSPEMVLRPKAGIGLSTLVAGIEDDTESESYFSIAPGAQFLYLLDPLFITAEARYNIVFTSENEATGESPDANALILSAGVGATF